MFIKSILLILVLFKSGECLRENCSDCTFVQDCPEAKALRFNNDPKIVDKLKKSTCAWIRTNNKHRWIRKVCCSDFSDHIHNNLALLPKKCGEKYEERIFGGEFAGLYDYPWMAILYYKTFAYKGRRIPRPVCAGSIINSKYILTAAHCIIRDKQLSVRVGDYDILRDCDFDGSHSSICEYYVKDYVVQKIIVNEQYVRVRQKTSNDIALLRVGEPFDFEHKNVAPICLPVTDNLMGISLDGKNATVAGWGITATGKRSFSLQHVVIPIWTETRCQSFLINDPDNAFDINEPMKILCAGEQGKDSCNGDSGGPLMLQEEYNNNMRMILFGVVSKGPSDCGTSTPGQYTEVKKYIEWILDNIEA